MIINTKVYWRLLVILIKDVLSKCGLVILLKLISGRNRHISYMTSSFIDILYLFYYKYKLSKAKMKFIYKKISSDIIYY